MTMQRIIERANAQWQQCHSALDELLTLKDTLPLLQQENATLQSRVNDLNQLVEPFAQAQSIIATLEEQVKNTVPQQKLNAVLEAHAQALQAQKEQLLHNHAQELAAKLLACENAHTAQKEALAVQATTQEAQFAALLAQRMANFNAEKEALTQQYLQQENTLLTKLSTQEEEFAAQKNTFEQQIAVLNSELASKAEQNTVQQAEELENLKLQLQQEMQQDIASVRLAARDEIDAVRLAAREEIAIVQITANDEIERLRADLAVVRRERDFALNHAPNTTNNAEEQNRLTGERKRLAESIKKTETLSNEVHRLLATFGLSKAEPQKTETSIIHTPIKEVAL